MKKLLVFGAAEFQIPLIKRASEQGIHTCVLDINPRAEGCKYADQFFVCSLKDYEKALRIAQDYKPDGITAGMCDVAVLSVAKIARELGLPGIDPKIALKSTNKYEMIKAFTTAGVPCPKYQYYEANDKLTIDENLTFPIIAKPIDMAGSRGINLIKTQEDLPKGISASIAASDSGKIVLEEFMVGPEVSVEIVVKDNEPYVLQITDKITSGAPHFVELGHSQPSTLPDSIKENISDVACQAVRSLEIKDAIVHAEIIITENGPKMVELGARMGGDGIHQQLIKLSTGIDLPELAIKIAMGQEFDIPKEVFNMHSMIRFIPSISGKVSCIDIDESINDDYQVKAYKIYCKQGEEYKDQEDNSGRFGYVITQANSFEETNEICLSALSKINITMI